MSMLYTYLYNPVKLKFPVSLDGYGSGGYFGGYLSSYFDYTNDNNIIFDVPVIPALDLQTVVINEEQWGYMSYFSGDYTKYFEFWDIDFTPYIGRLGTISTTDGTFRGFIGSANKFYLLEYEYEMFGQGVTRINLGGATQLYNIYEDMAFFENFYGKISSEYHIENAEYFLSQSLTIKNTKFYGYDSDGNPAKSNIFTGVNNGPKIYMGSNKNDVVSTVQNKKITYKENCHFNGLEFQSHNDAVSPAVPYANYLETQNNNLFSDCKLKDYRIEDGTIARIEPALFNTVFKNSIIDQKIASITTCPTMGLRADSNRLAYVARCGNGFNNSASGDIIATCPQCGMIVNSSMVTTLDFNQTFSYENLTIVKRDEEFYGDYHHVFPDGLYPAILSYSYPSTNNSKSFTYIKSLLVVDFDRLFGIWGGTNPANAIIKIDKLAIQNCIDYEACLEPYKDYVEIGELIIIPPDEKIFRDKDNGDYTIVHPLLLEKQIGAGSDIKSGGVSIARIFGGI